MTLKDETRKPINGSTVAPDRTQPDPPPPSWAARPLIVRRGNEAILFGPDQDDINAWDDPC